MILNKERLAILYFLISILFLVIIIRLIFLQIINPHFYRKLADKQYNIALQCNPDRGLIFDCFGQKLALNKNSYSAFLSLQNVYDYNEMLNFLSMHFPESVERFLKNANKNFFILKGA